VELYSLLAGAELLSLLAFLTNDHRGERKGVEEFFHLSLSKHENFSGNREAT
jgi:hypothetical protein